MNKLLEYLGILMLLAGITAVVIFAFYFDTTVRTGSGDLVHNVGLIAERQNGLIIGFGFAFLGTAFLFAGHMMTVRKGQPESFVLNEQGKRQWDSFLNRAKTISADLVSRSKAAAQLTSKQATRTKIATLDLPRAFAALGQHLYSAGTYRDEFANLHQQIDKLKSDVAAIEAQAASKPKAQGMADKAKSVASSAKDMVQIKALQRQANQAFTELAKVAYESHGESSGPEVMVRPISDHKNRISGLDGEIAALSSAPSGTIVTPKRIAIGAGICIALLFLTLIWRSFGDHPAQQRRSNTDQNNPSVSLPAVVNANDHTNGAATATRSVDSFLDRIKQMVQDGIAYGDPTAYPVNCPLDSFVSTMGEPETNIAIGDRRTWGYKCSDGQVRLTVTVGGGRLIIFGANVSRTTASIAGRLTKKQAKQQIAELAGGFLPNGRAAGFIAYAKLVSALGQPFSEIQLGRVEERRWTYRCTDGVISMKVQVVFKSANSISDVMVQGIDEI